MTASVVARSASTTPTGPTAASHETAAVSTYRKSPGEDTQTRSAPRRMYCSQPCTNVSEQIEGDRRARCQCRYEFDWTARSIISHLSTGLCVPGPGRGNPRERTAGSVTDITHRH